MKKLTDNKGYSLVEIMVVIALIAIGTTILATSLAVIFSNNARQVAVNIDAFISKGIVNANYRKPVVYIEIYDDGRNIIADYYEGGEPGSGGGTGSIGELKSREVMGSNRVNVVLIDGGSPEPLPLVIAFQRGTGRMYRGLDFSSDDFNNLINPVIRAGSATNYYEIRLIPLTGGHSVTKG